MGYVHKAITEYFRQQHTLQNASGQVTEHPRDQDTHQAGSQNWATALWELALQTVVTTAQEEPEHELHSPKDFRFTFPISVLCSWQSLDNCQSLCSHPLIRPWKPGFTYIFSFDLVLQWFYKVLELAKGEKVLTFTSVPDKSPWAGNNYT